MCGRATLATPADVIAALYGILPEDMPELSPRYNIAPSQPLLTIRADEDGRRTSVYTWGFTSEKKGLTINARAETVARLPQFREAFAKRRCVIPVDGFYEWETIGKRKQPFHFHRADGRPFSIAGLWTPASDTAARGRVVVLTTAARGEIARIHDRMPVVLPQGAVADWFAPATRFRDLFAMLDPGDDGSTVGTPVSLAVNDASYDAPDCIRPAPTLLG